MKIPDSVNNDSSDMLDLLGLSYLPHEQKQKIYKELFIIIVMEFLSEKLSSIKNVEKLLFIRRLMNDKKSPDIILAYISKQIPDFLNEFTAFTQKKKYEIVRSYFDEMIKTLEKKLTLLKTPAARAIVTKQLEMYRKSISSFSPTPS